MSFSMSISNKLFNEVLGQKQSFMKNKDSFMKGIRETYKGDLMTKPKSIYFEVGHNNQTFINICENSEKIKNELNKLWVDISDGLIEFNIDCRVMTSVVNDVVRIHPQILLHYGNCGFVTICPLGDNSIELSTIRVVPHLRGTSMGSIIMTQLLEVLEEYQSEDFKTIMLECVGSLGSGDDREVSSISQQTKFFRRFGFRVVESKNNRGGGLDYVKMNFFNDKVDYDYINNIRK